MEARTHPRAGDELPNAGSFLVGIGRYRFVAFLLGAAFAFALTHAIGRFGVPRLIERL